MQFAWVKIIGNAVSSQDYHSAQPWRFRFNPPVIHTMRYAQCQSLVAEIVQTMSAQHCNATIAFAYKDHAISQSAQQQMAIRLAQNE